jgi:type VI secretion system protein ImpK
MTSFPSDSSDKLQLPALASDSLLLILQLRAAGSNLGNPDTLRRRILGFLDLFERQAQKANHSIDSIQQVKFALAAFIDETIITSDWGNKDSWFENPLQLQLFNRFDAGDEFFDRLNELRRQPYDSIEILEVYYLCLVLGFKGKYGLSDREKLRVIIDETFHEIRRARSMSPRALSPNGKPKEEFGAVIRKGIPVWIFGAGAAAIGFIFYIVVLMLSQSNASRTVEFLRGLL